MSIKIIQKTIFLWFMFWTGLLFAHDPDLTRYPLTFYYGDTRIGGTKKTFYIRYAFNTQTLQDLFNNGNPLGLSSGADYDSALRQIINLKVAPETKEQRQCFPYTIEDIGFSQKSLRERYLLRLMRILEKKGLSAFVDDRTRLHDLKPSLQSLCLCHDLFYRTIPDSLIPPFAQNLLSLGDNVVQVDKNVSRVDVVLREKKSTSFRLASHCNRDNHACKLNLAGDIKIAAMEKLRHQGQEIVAIPLDNRVSFKEQLHNLGFLGIKFQFIIGRKILCRCNENAPSQCCGGIDLAEESQMLLFLQNVASILDETSSSVAILSGGNAIEPYEIQKAVLMFNNLPSFFAAEIFRTGCGEFYGILIKERKPKLEIVPPAAEEAPLLQLFGIKNALLDYFLTTKTTF